MIKLASEGHTAPAIAAYLRLNAQTVRDWIKRFNAAGLAGLEDLPRSGKPPTYTPEQTGAVIACALSAPRSWSSPSLAGHSTGLPYT
jgi:transposase